MNVPFVELQSQYKSIQKDINRVISDVLTGGVFIGGEPVAAFEREFADYIGTKHCIAVNSGTDALILGARALELPKGAEIIIPANTFYASALSATENGFTPVFVDCDEEYGISLPDLKKKLTKKTAAVCVVHLYGRADNYDEIRRVIHGYNKSIKIFEDAAQAHGARYKNRQVGTLGDFAIFSFYPAKNLGAYGDGGAMTTNSAIIAKRVQLLHEYGQTKKYHHDALGVNSRLDTMQAAILSVKLKKLNAWIHARQKIAHVYRTQLQGIPDLVTAPETVDRPGTYHLYVIRTPKRDALHTYLHKQGIHTQIHYPIPLHLQKAFAYLGHKKGDFPTAESYAKTMLSLPIYPELTTKQVEYVCHHIRTFCSR